MGRPRSGFEGWAAIVTGGASGIGRALASELARTGAFVTIVDVRDDIDVVAEELDRGRGRVTAARADVRDAEALRHVVGDVDAPPAVELPLDAWTMTGREYMGRVGFPPTSPERFARRAMRGIAAGRAVVLGSPRGRLLWLLHRASPSLTDRVGRQIGRRLVRASS